MKSVATDLSFPILAPMAPAIASALSNVIPIKEHPIQWGGRGSSGVILLDNDSEEMLMFKKAAEAYDYIEVLKWNGDLKDHFLADVEVDYMVYAN